MGQIELDTPVQYVKGVGPTRGSQLAQLGVNTVEDLLLYFPFRFDLRKQAQPMASLKGAGEPATVVGQVMAAHEQRFGKRPFFQVELADESGWVFVKWFHGGYLSDKVRIGTQLAVSGNVTTYHEAFQMVNPKHQIIWDGQGVKLDRDEMMPVYPAGGKLTSAMIAALVKRVLPSAQALLPRWFSREYLAARGLQGRPEAVVAMHHPEDKDHWRIARRRIAYDECLVMQLGMALSRMRQISRPAYAMPNSDEIDRRIRARFPFALTPAQDRAVADVSTDLARSSPMSRLIQGDVGSGKTVVALYAALQTVARGRQAAIMAPTEILAAQHHRKVTDYLQGSRVRTELLVGQQGAKRRKATLAALARGEIDIVVGTHALISKDVRFAHLALVVVDEQHKFGVRQRTSFRGKGYAPHYLVMTATPIPRTLAMTVFGDLDVSVIDALPPGRGRTDTKCVSHDQLPDVLDFVRGMLADGQQAYFIYPLVSPSPQLELTSANEAYAELASGPLADFSVALVHGQMPPREKESVMEDFAGGKVQALVASVVVEVGLDVPAANVMVIMHAERFGLAQLHQLRGRIGRSSADARCVLVASPNSEMARRRLAILESTHDGFKIAEEDLRLRGPGEFFSTRQHGMPELKVADLIEDFDLMRLARRDAFDIVREDPDISAPHHQRLRGEVLRAYQGKLDLLTGA